MHRLLQFTHWTLALAAVVCLLAGNSEPAGIPDRLREVRPYLRSTNGADGVLRLQVALRQLEPRHGRGPALWLVAVTHIGTSNYYADLQRFLDAQSLVLYEAVQSQASDKPRPRGDYSLQAELARALGLTFQMDAIDYERPHFRNSDLTLEQLQRLFGVAESTAGKAPATNGPPAPGAMEFGVLMQAMTGEGLFGGLARMGVSLIGASPRLQASLKVAMVEVLSQLPNDLTQMAGLPPGLQKLMRVLVEERNRTVLRDVKTALAARPKPKSIAAFYGAGHMADLEWRLCEALGYRAAQDRWLTAFEVNPKAAGVSEFELEFTRRMVRQQFQAGPPTK